MSGRIYDINPGIPICPNCKGEMLRSEETNFNGMACLHCDHDDYEYTEIYFDENHPIWIKYQQRLEADRVLNIFVDFSYGLKEFKKEYERSNK